MYFNCFLGTNLLNYLSTIHQLILFLLFVRSYYLFHHFTYHWFLARNHHHSIWFRLYHFHFIFFQCYHLINYCLLWIWTLIFCNTNSDQKFHSFFIQSCPLKYQCLFIMFNCLFLWIGYPLLNFLFFFKFHLKILCLMISAIIQIQSPYLLIQRN